MNSAGGDVNVDAVTITQVVPARPDRVFEAWTDASILQSWWRPPGGRCIGAEIDLRVGGRYSIANELPDGSVVTIDGTFLEISSPDSLTYTWRIGATSADEHVHVTFMAEGDGTLVTIRHARIPGVATAEAHRAGWQSCLSGLVAIF